MRDFTLLSGNLLSFNMAGLPLADPLAMLQAAIGAGFTTTMLISAVPPLLLAMALGRVFCSWLCPYGLISELTGGLKHSYNIDAPENAACAKRHGNTSTSKPQNTLSQKQSRHIPDLESTARRAELTRLVLALGGLSALWLIRPVPMLNQISMPGWYSRAWQHVFFYGEFLWGALLIAALALAEYAAGKRFWCRFLCPQALLISLAAALPFGLRRRFEAKKCTCAKNYRACADACHLDLDPRRQDALSRLGCTNCGDCVDACSARGKALSLRWRSSLP